MKYFLMLILICFSAFFSGSEIALSRERKITDRMLITILIGNNLVNIFTSSIATMIAISILGNSGAWLATFVITILILTFGEILPKIVCSKKSEAFCRICNLPLKVLCFISFPFVWLFEKSLDLISMLWIKRGADDESLTEDDLETMIDTVEDEGVLDEDTADLLQGALDFGDTMACEILVPRVDLEVLDIDDDYEEIRQTIINTRYTRLPVYEDTIDNVIGIVNVKDLLLELVSTGTFDVRKNLKEPLFVPGTTKIDEILDEMQHKRKHLAIVTDEYGGVDGIVTMEDILEQIVGEIWDEQDIFDPEFVEISDNSYIADGEMRLLDVFEELDIRESEYEDESLTLGGFIVEKLEDYAEKGDSIEYQNYIFTVLDAEEHRVNSVQITEKLTETEEE